MLPLIFIFFYFCVTKSDRCPTEQSIVFGTKVRAEWTSDESIRNQIVTSVPPCLNNNKLITRICINGSWHPVTAPLCENFSQEWFRNGFLNSEESFWLAAQRVVKFGPFEHTGIGDDYGSTVSLNTSDYRWYYSGDCLIADAKTKIIQVENCTTSHKFQSAYDCPNGCQPANANYQCFCKSHNCQNLATIETINDKKRLEALTGNDLCRLGGTTPQILKGLHPYLSNNSWYYGNFRTNCSICVRQAPDSVTTKMVLSFEDKKRRLFLLVYSPEGIKRHDNKFQIFCFTNAAKLSLKEKSKIDLIWENLEPNNHFPNSLLVYKVKTQKYMGEYWCEAFSSKLSLLRSDKVIAFEKKRGNEYALRLRIDNVCKIYSCNLNEFFSYVTDAILEKAFKEFNPEVRIMEVFNFDTYHDVLDVLVHISTGKNNDVIAEYASCLGKLKTLKHIMEVVFFRSSEYCLPEKTWRNLSWPLTKINNAVVPEEFCFAANGTPVTRQCQGTFLYGGVWSNMTEHCVQNLPVSQTTVQLKEMTKLNVSGRDVWRRIKNSSLTVLDIYYLSLILGKIPERDSSYALEMVNKLMMTDERVLTKSQNLLNLTDSTLETTDDILANLTVDQEVYFVQKKNLIVHAANPFYTNISGVLLYEENGTVSVQNFRRADRFEDTEKNNLRLAVYIPEMILEQLLNETDNVSDVFIITTIFHNDNLFVDDNYRSGGFVVSVSIPGYGSYLQTPIPVIFGSKNNSESKECGFWDNGKKTNWKKGQWSVLGSNHKTLDNLHVCSFVHLTHFALLVMSDRKNLADDEDQLLTQNFEDYNENTLEILTIIGFSLSGFGIVGIFLTAFLFEKWRNKIGTKILLNLALAILLEIICIQLSEIKHLKKSEYACKIIGIMLHYVVLSKFCWMLIYALLQYHRFVKVIAAVPKNLILKSVIFGWGVPLGFVFIVGLASRQSYASSSYELCYPRGLLLYLTVILPICVIVLANLAIFVLVMCSISPANRSTSCGNNKSFRLRLYLALLLFSVLGIPWVFGIAAELMYFSSLKIVLFYIFCITATLQGFVLFLFYVVLNKETRQCWLRYVTQKCTCMK